MSIDWFPCGNTIKLNQYLSFLILTFVLIALTWPLIAKAITGDEEGFYTHTTKYTVLRATGGPTVAPKTPPVRVSVPKSSIGVLERIAACESQNVATAKNPKSTASGRFQFLKGSWEGYGKELWGSTEGKDVFSYEDNTELAEYVYGKYGASPWEASRYCWG